MTDDFHYDASEYIYIILLCTLIRENNNVQGIQLHLCILTLHTIVSLSLHPLSLICAGPNHGGKREGEVVSLFEMFWVLMVQGDDLIIMHIKLRG